MQKIVDFLKSELQITEESVSKKIAAAFEKGLEEEKVHMIRQIIESMSVFIDEVAKEAQGGIRFFNELPYFVSIHNREHKILSTNLSFKKHLGDMADADSWAIYDGDMSSREACPVGKTLASGKGIIANAVVRYVSGAKVPVIVHTAPLRKRDGEIELVLEVFAGTREIEKMGSEIRTTQQRYRQLFDSVPSYIAVLDRRLRINAANRQFLEDFGDQTDKPFFDVFTHSGAEFSQSPIDQTVTDGRPHQSEMVLRTQNGSQYNILAWTSPIKTPAGKLIQILVIFVDITELRELRDNLSSLGLMISTISHHLKGSLTGLDAGLYMIDTGFYRNKPGRIEEGLDVSKMMAERIRKIIYDTLYYAKDRDLELEEVEVLPFVSDVAANVDKKIRSANIEFIFDVGQNLGKIEIDTALIRAALINLLDNAMEACIEDRSNREYTICFNVRRAGEDILMTIGDNGCGIDEKQLKEVFSIFYSSKGHKGTGLGLFITKQIVQKHNGEITVESKVDEGTRFHIRLPK
jgi:PAS domain S-box-containing protein